MPISDIEPAYSLTLAELRAFCMVCEFGNLSQVAVHLGISQSSVSQMVQRWRQVVGDQLFVRSRYGVTPTEAALALRQRIQPLLNEMRLALAQPLGFDAMKSDRIFKLHMSDIGQLVFLSELVSHLSKRAPHVRLFVRNFAWDDIETALGSGDVDIAMGSLPMIKGRVHARTLRAERYVTIMRRKHHLAKAKLDLAAFASAEHLVIDSTSSGHSLIEGVLRAKGIHRRIGLSIPHYLAIEGVLARSDYLLTVPEVAVSVLHQVSAYHIVPTPLQLPTFDIRVHWHERSKHDDGVQWLRNSIVEMFATQ